jgi:hypothetical protein
VDIVPSRQEQYTTREQTLHMSSNFCLFDRMLRNCPCSFLHEKVLRRRARDFSVGIGGDLYLKLHFEETEILGTGTTVRRP